jgi:hypothetical protein
VSKDHQHLICQVCYASIPLEPDHLYEGHLRWHKTLTNLPYPDQVAKVWPDPEEEP